MLAPAPSTPRATPAKDADSPGPVAGAVQAEVPGSAESPASCSGTGAGPAETPGGSLPLTGERQVVRPQAGLPEAWGLRGGVRCLDSTCIPPNSLTCFCSWLLGHLALLDRTMFWLGAPRNSLSGVLFSSNAQTTHCLPPAHSALAGDR